MRILALETDIDTIKCRFLCEGEEQEVLTTHYHGLSFLFASLREFFITVGLFVVGMIAWQFDAPMGITVAILAVTWFFFVFFNILKAWIDWCYDFIFVTTDKLVIVDQTSIIRSKIKPIHMENIGSVTSVTQFWDIFNCGIVQIDLKEGHGGDHIILRYVPEAKDVASRISDAVTRFQKRGSHHTVNQQTPPQPVSA